MSALPLDLITLYIATCALVINTVVGLVLMRRVSQQPEIRVLLPPLDAGFGHNAAGGGRTAEGDGPTLEPGPLRGVESDGDRGAGLQPVRQGDLAEVVDQERSSLPGESPALHRDFLDGDREVSGVDHVDGVRPAVLVRQVDAHETHPNPHGVTPDHPPGVEHAERGADHGDRESDPSDPVHGAEHSGSETAKQCRVVPTDAEELLALVRPACAGAWTRFHCTNDPQDRHVARLLAEASEALGVVALGEQAAAYRKRHNTGVSE